MNTVGDAERNPEKAMHPGALNAMGLIDEASHALVQVYREKRDPKVMVEALTWFGLRLGADELDRTLLAFSDQFPMVDIYRGKSTAREWLPSSTAGVPHRAIALEEVMMLWLANKNPAFKAFLELFDDQSLEKSTAYKNMTAGLREYFDTRPRFENQNLVDILRAPALASPDSLAGQLAYIREKWVPLLGELGGSLRRLLTALDILRGRRESDLDAATVAAHDHFGGGSTLARIRRSGCPRVTVTASMI